MRLLMVNDAILEAETMKKEIHWEKYGISEVFVRFNAEDARLLLQKEPIEILLCDIEMPGENGISLIRWIRQQNLDMECLLLTCHADFAYAQEAIALHCQNYILLPAKYEEIGDAVLQAVRRHLANQENNRLQSLGKDWLATKQDPVLDASSQSPKAIINACQKYILEHISNENLSISDLADQFYITPTYLNRIFKRENGLSISQWMIQKRMQLAVGLMENTDYSAIAIAAEVGYLNYPYFSSVFKKYYHLSPSQYIKKVRNTENPGIPFDKNSAK